MSIDLNEAIQIVGHPTIRNVDEQAFVRLCVCVFAFVFLHLFTPTAYLLTGVRLGLLKFIEYYWF